MTLPMSVQPNLNRHWHGVRVTYLIEHKNYRRLMSNTMSLWSL